MRPSFSAQTKELESRLQAAVQRRPEWWLDYVQKNAEIRPLPYHTNLGLSEVEYKTLLRLYKTKRLTQSGNIVLECKHAEGGRIRLSSEQLPRVVAPIIIDAAGLEAEVPLATLAKAERVEVKERDGGGVFGPHTGYRWHTEQGSLESGKYKSVDLNVLRQASDHRVFIYYTGKRMQNYELKDNFEVILELQQNDSNQSGAANGSQPIRSETNSTSSAAGSRR